ncbi:MAG: pilus assembly protein [Anaerolineales bacterium]
MNQTIFPFLLNQNVRVGLMKYGGGGVQGNQGGEVVAPVDAHSLGTLQNYMSSNIAQAALLQNANSQPLGAAMWDAWLYWVGNPTGGGDHANSQYQGNDPDLKSPIQHWCQPNHMIVIATGASFENIGTSNPIAKLNKDGVDDGFYLPEASTYLYNNLDYVVQGNQARVKTHVIQMMTSKLARMEEAAGNGRGLYRNVTDSKAILDALTEIILAILEADSSFVAPVVPANPENQAYSGDRIYLGFFKPMNDEPWCGNIKKFALDHQNRMLGFNSSGDLVSAVDQYGDFVVDQFDQPAVSSFWSPQNLDGGLVDAGGVGERLLLRSFDRNIYTLPTSPTANTQLQDLELSSISASTLDVAIEGDTEASDEAATKLINFIYGSDSYGEYPDGDGKRRWIKGDVMHSKPVILNYNNYPFTEANESNATINKSYIFVGGNDGMLHAYRDVDGSEAWAFVPPELLPNLKYLRDYERHHYYIDGSPVIYVHDANGDGCIGTMVEDAEGDLSCSVGVGSDDKAILLFGMRRGGGSSTLGGGTSGSTYYALDITMPDNPKFLWRINSATTGFSEMGQTWSLPTPAKMKIGSHTKIVAVIGGGYDTNEDLRYGSIQSFPESNSDTVTSLAPSGEGAVTSPGGKDQHNPTGRAVYFVDIATLNESGISLSGSGSLIWAATDSNMLFSFPSDPLVVDSNFDGYADTVYVGDTGGQLWRLDVNSPTEIETKWKATRIFVANSGNTDMGRKIFYKPTATINGHDTFIFFGTGDREHPLNTAVTDRFYMVRDRRVPFYITDNSTISDYNKTHSLWNYSSPLSETNLVDVTENDLQDGNLTEEAAKTFRAKLSPPFFTDGTTTYYGWYIMLDEEFHDGEKVLASPRVFDGKVFFTTYQPTAHTQENDPCVGVLGPARLYIVDMFTGEAVFNLYKGNDQIDGTPVLERRDRYLEPGRGIASEPIVRVDKFGNVSVLVGRGGGFFNSAENPDVDLGTFDPLYPIYWMKW